MATKRQLIWVAKLLPLGAIAAAVALLLVMTGGDHHRVEANTPHPGLDFSIGVNTDGNTATGDQRLDHVGGNPRGDDCVSFNVQGITATPVAPPKCSVPLNGNFTVHVYLNALGGIASYQAYDVQLNYSAITSAHTADFGPNNGNWPNCGFGASNFDDVNHTESFSCTIGVSAPPSTYVGRMATAGFTCSPTNGFGTVTVVHGPSSTDILEDVATADAEGNGTTETLTITCGTPPTATRTPTPTPTATLTPTITPTLTITPTPTNSPTATNTATATPLPSDQPDVTVIKTDSPDPVDANGTLTYSLLVKNLGLQTATGVLVGDQLPSGVVFLSANSTGAVCGYNSGLNFVLCALTSPLPLNGQVKIVIQATAPTPPVDTRISNTAQVSADNEPFFNQSNNTDVEETVVLAPRADLTLTKVDEADPVDSGATLVYDLTVDNIGPQKATNVIIKENLPAGSTFLPGSSSAECSAPIGAPLPDSDIGELDVQCDMGASFVGEATVQVAITVPLERRDAIIENRAFVTGGNELFAQTGNNLAVQYTAVLAPPPEVAIDKTGPDHVRRVAKFSYTLNISNTGYGDAFNVGVSDTLPQNSINGTPQPMTVQSITGASCGTPVNSQFTCTIPKLPGSIGSAVITVNVRAPTTLVDVPLTNQASVTVPGEPGDNPLNNSDSVLTTLRACFDVNGDSLVRAIDLVMEVAHYNEHVGDPGYDLIYDFDGNGVITGTDILAVTQHYNQTCPP